MWSVLKFFFVHLSSYYLYGGFESDTNLVMIVVRGCVIFTIVGLFWSDIFYKCQEFYQKRKKVGGTKMVISRGINKELEIEEFTYSTGIRAKKLEKGIDIKSFIKIYYLREHVADYDFDRNSGRDILTVHTQKKHIENKILDNLEMLKDLSN